MKIFLPNSSEIQRYIGPGGYRAGTFKIDIQQNVGVVGIYDVIIPPHHVSQEHYHNALTELFYLKTPMRIKINREEHHLPAESIVVLHPGDRHEEYAGEKEVSYLAIKFPDIEGDKTISHE